MLLQRVSASCGQKAERVRDDPSRASEIGRFCEGEEAHNSCGGRMRVDRAGSERWRSGRIGCVQHRDLPHSQPPQYLGLSAW